MVENFAFNQVQSQLGVPDSSSFFPINKSETIIVENHPIVLQKLFFYNSFVLGINPNGLLGDSRFVLGLSPTTPSFFDQAIWDVNLWDAYDLDNLTDHYIVANDNDTFQWRFRFTQGAVDSQGFLSTVGFTDDANSVGTEDTDTLFNFIGTVWQSLPIFRDPSEVQKITSATLSLPEGSNVATATAELSNDGGVTWTTVTYGEVCTFGALGSDLRIRLTGAGAGWPTSFGTWGSSSTMIIERIICEYTRV